jgi:serine/threonine protein kinase
MSMIGKALAHYEITGQLGKGGMGEVYQAKDQKLGRDVAIKALPEEFAKDIIVGIAIWLLKQPPPPEPRQVMRFEYDLPEGQQLTGLDLSPDGKQFVYSTAKGIYVRSVNELTAKLIAGTEGPASQPFYSPDGKWIGYFTLNDNGLKKTAISGGAPINLCTAMA